MDIKYFERHFICPACKGRVRLEGERFTCLADGGHTYEIEKGVPILLERAEYERFRREAGGTTLMKREYTGGFFPAAIKIVKKLIGSTLHLPVSRNVRDTWEAYRDEPSLEIGSGTTKRMSGMQVNLDIGVFKNVDIAASASSIPFADGTFRLVRDIALLEHVSDPELVVKEIFRVLKPGGYAYTEVPFLQHYHAYPADFRRYTMQGLKELFKGFEIVETGICEGPGSALTAMAADWFELFSFSKNRFINDIFRVIPLVMLLPVKFLDFILVKNPRAHEAASGIYALCKKP
ncbi:methyltransferase domain-containing protein [Candidatus Omnitrophota bacterium]